MSSDPKDALIVALNPDPSSGSPIEEIGNLVDKLESHVSFYKVGIDLGLANEFKYILELLLEREKKIFLDMKYLDVEDVINLAVRALGKIKNVEFLTIDGNGSNKIINAAVKGKTESGSQVKLLAVTLLTSFNENDLKEVYGDNGKTIDNFVLERATRLLKAGRDVVIASGKETKMLREKLPEEIRDKIIVTPGIRRPKDSKDDHKRYVKPTEAILAGANYLVVGRPITKSEDPLQAVKEILAEMKEAFNMRNRAQNH